MGRNDDKHTDADVARANVLRHLSECQYPIPKSSLGYAAFPGYRFKAPQGAAFAVAKIARELQDDGLIRLELRGWSITAAGRLAAQQST